MRMWLDLGAVQHRRHDPTTIRLRGAGCAVPATSPGGTGCAVPATSPAGSIAVASHRQIFAIPVRLRPYSWGYVRVPAVPHRLRSYAALQLPVPIGRGSGSPCLWPTARASACSFSSAPYTRRQRACRRRVTGSPVHRSLLVEGSGSPRLLGRPLRACRGRTPRQAGHRLAPSFGGDRAAFQLSHAWGDLA